MTAAVAGPGNLERPEVAGHPRRVSGGWPRILSNLESLLESGASVLKPSVN